MVSTCGQFKSRKTDVVFFSFKLNIDAFIRSIYHTICLQVSEIILFRVKNKWERNGNFNAALPYSCLFPVTPAPPPKDFRGGGGIVLA